MKHLFFLLLTVIPTMLLSQGYERVAIDFLESFGASRAKVLYDLNDPKRDHWHYFPATMFKRPGIKLGDLSKNQKVLLHQLLKSSLSDLGYEKVTGVIELEGILGQLTNNPSYRDTKKYFIAFYGDPSKNRAWAWRLEGHHLSIHFTYADGKVSLSPRFLGANPAKVPSSPKEGWELLKVEEELGLKLVNMLEPNQQKVAIYKNSTHGDIVSGNDSRVQPMKVVGISINELKPNQRDVLIQLIFEYVSASPQEISIERMAQVRLESNHIHFGWAGGIQRGEPHYYRIQGKTFLIEFDNTQNKGNHIHSVWRDLEGDFGRDLLKEHYENSGHH